MSNPQPPPAGVSPPYGADEIRRRLDACPKLASLQSINRALRNLINAEDGLTSQVAEIIRRDPSLSARVLRMVNSVYFALSARINNIEEAVFFLGLARIRELAMATPVIQDLERLQPTRLPEQSWKDLWAHSISTAVLTREILASAPVALEDDTDYLVGLLHNVGKIVMAYAFPEEMMKVAGTPAETPAEVCALEREHIGWDHAQIGAYFLERHQLAEELVFAVRYHNEPEQAPCHHYFAAAVQVADYLARHSGLPAGFEKIEPIADDAWTELSGWNVLYGSGDSPESEQARESLPLILKRLPAVIEGVL